MTTIHEENAPIRIIGWNDSKGQSSSSLSNLLLRTEWDFTQYDNEPSNSQMLFYMQGLADGLQKTLAAANAIGNLEHTNDWDPVLLIRFRDGSTFDTDSHYYLIEEIDEDNLYVEAPELEDYAFNEETPPEEYYQQVEGKPRYVIPLAAISLIVIDSQ